MDRRRSLFMFLGTGRLEAKAPKRLSIALDILLKRLIEYLIKSSICSPLLAVRFAECIGHHNKVVSGRQGATRGNRRVVNELNRPMKADTPPRDRVATSSA